MNFRDRLKFFMREGVSAGRRGGENRCRTTIPQNPAGQIGEFSIKKGRLAPVNEKKPFGFLGSIALNSYYLQFLRPDVRTFLHFNYSKHRN